VKIEEDNVGSGVQFNGGKIFEGEQAVVAADDRLFEASSSEAPRTQLGKIIIIVDVKDAKRVSGQ
jgi:hypothetical protein